MPTQSHEKYWVLGLGLIACLAFYFIVGAVDPGDVLSMTLIITGACVVWGLHMWLDHRHTGAGTASPARLTHTRRPRGV